MATYIKIAGIGVRVGGEAMPHRDMLYEAVREAYHEAGVTRHDIDTAVTVSSDLAEGRSLANQYTLDSIGGVMRPFDLRLANESLHALAAGALELHAGKGRRAVVAGVLRSSDMEDLRAGMTDLVGSRLHLHYERAVADSFPGDLEIAMAQMMQREGGGPATTVAAPHIDVAVALVLEAGDSADGVILSGIGWHDRSGWQLSHYERSVAAAAAAARRWAGNPLTPSWVEVPAYPPVLVEASLRALGLSRSPVEVNPSRLDGQAQGNHMLEGLLWTASSVKRLRGLQAGTVAMVQSWQGPGTASTAVALLLKS